MIFEIIVISSLGLLAIGLLVLFLYIRSLRVIMADMSRQCDEEISSLKTKSETLVTGLNNTIKTLKILSNKVGLEFKNIHRDMVRAEQIRKRKELISLAPSVESKPEPKILPAKPKE